MAKSKPQPQASNAGYSGYIPPELQVPLTAGGLPAGMTPQQLQQKQAELAVKLKDTIEAIKVKAEDFKKEVLSKYKKETLGMVIAPLMLFFIAGALSYKATCSPSLENPLTPI